MQIIIVGRTNEGKTTIASLIAETLRNVGFKVEERDEDIMAGNHYPEGQKERVTRLAPITAITIITQQIKGV